MNEKIKNFCELEKILNKWKSEGKKVVQCHGVFDLLHPGHIRHFQQAKSQGDKLVVSVTPDRFVNKGPGRPAFQEKLRLESLASLETVDCVVLNETPDAVFAIEKIQPDVYVKGKEYENHAKDVTGKISEEALAVEKNGGKIFYTDDIVFSSSSLLNQYFSSLSPETQKFLQKMKSLYTPEQAIKKIEELANLEVVVVGDAILDEYQYVTPLGQTGKGTHMVAACLDKELFLGGSLIVANHIAQFVKKVVLITAIGKECPHKKFIEEKLYSNIEPVFIYHDKDTLTKKRYLLKDGNHLTKLFETYSSHGDFLDHKKTQEVISVIKKIAKNTDLVLSADFGNGFTNPFIIEALEAVSPFLAVNTQVNSGNRGFHFITNYKRADFISLNEPELRLAAQDRTSSLEGISHDILQVMNASVLSVTRGVEGLYCLGKNEEDCKIPALLTQYVDRLGAGDSYFSLSSLCLAKKYPLLFSGFIGSVAAALDVQVVGNKESVKKVELCKFLTRLLK